MKEKLNSVIQGLKKVNLILLAFLAFSVKGIMSSPNLTSAATLLVVGLVYTTCRYIALKEPQRVSNKVKSDIDKLNGEVKELKGALAKTNIAKIAKKERYF